jgi:C4-type Zn-finger protein
VRGYSNGNWPHWTLPVMYTACKFLRLIAIKSDEQAKKQGKKPEHLEDAARHINRTFTLCISDRCAPSLLKQELQNLTISTVHRLRNQESGERTIL